VSSGQPKDDTPPERLVLWWIPAHTTVFCFPVVRLVPTIKVNLRLKAVIKRPKHSFPSSVPGRKEVLLVPE
jgi:hypothetical protein